MMSMLFSGIDRRITLPAIHSFCRAAALTAALMCFADFAAAQRATPAGDAHWVATWAASQQQPRGPGRGPAPVQTAAQQNAGTAATSAPAVPPVVRPPTGFNNQTVRMVARASIGGNRLRVHLSNAFGSAPLVIGAAHVALRSH